MKPETPTCFLCDETKKGVKWGLDSLIWMRDNVTLCAEKHKPMVQNAVEKMQKDTRLPKEDDSTHQHPANEPKATAGGQQSGISRPSGRPTSPGVGGPKLVSGDFIDVKQHESKDGGIFFYGFFKTADGISARSCFYPKLGNYVRWAPYIERVKQGKSVRLDNLILKGHMIDADSFCREAA